MTPISKVCPYMSGTIATAEISPGNVEVPCIGRRCAATGDKPWSLDHAGRKYWKCHLVEAIVEVEEP
jgi:hypothetical protein